MNPATAETVQARILVVDDHPFMRQGIVDFLNGEPDLTVCAKSQRCPKFPLQNRI